MSSRSATSPSSACDAITHTWDLSCVAMEPRTKGQVVPTIIAKGECQHCEREIWLQQSLTISGKPTESWCADFDYETSASLMRWDCEDRPLYGPTDEEDPDGPQDVKGYDGHEPRAGWVEVDLPK